MDTNYYLPAFDVATEIESTPSTDLTAVLRQRKKGRKQDGEVIEATHTFFVSSKDAFPNQPGLEARIEVTTYFDTSGQPRYYIGSQGKERPKAPRDLIKATVASLGIGAGLVSYYYLDEHPLTQSIIGSVAPIAQHFFKQFSALPQLPAPLILAIVAGGVEYISDYNLTASYARIVATAFTALAMKRLVKSASKLGFALTLRDFLLPQCKSSQFHKTGELAFGAAANSKPLGASLVLQIESDGTDCYTSFKIGDVALERVRMAASREDDDDDDVEAAKSKKEVKKEQKANKKYLKKNATLLEWLPGGLKDFSWVSLTTAGAIAGSQLLDGEQKGAKTKGLFTLWSATVKASARSQSELVGYGGLALATAAAGALYYYVPNTWMLTVLTATANIAVATFTKDWAKDRLVTGKLPKNFLMPWYEPPEWMQKAAYTILGWEYQAPVRLFEHLDQAITKEREPNKGASLTLKIPHEGQTLDVDFSLRVDGGSFKGRYGKNSPKGILPRVKGEEPVGWRGVLMIGVPTMLLTVGSYYASVGLDVLAGRVSQVNAIGQGVATGIFVSMFGSWLKLEFDRHPFITATSIVTLAAVAAEIGEGFIPADIKTWAALSFIPVTALLAVMGKFGKRVVFDKPVTSTKGLITYTWPSWESASSGSEWLRGKISGAWNSATSWFSRPPQEDRVPLTTAV